MKVKKTRFSMMPNLTLTTLSRWDQILGRQLIQSIHCISLIHKAFHCRMSNNSHSTVAGSVGTSSPFSSHASTVIDLHAVIQRAFPQRISMCASITLSARGAFIYPQSLLAVSAMCTSVQDVPPVIS